MSKQKWRLIENGTYDAYTNMAIDEALALTVKKTNIPIIRLGYRWKKPGAVSLGINQNAGDINIQYCKKNKIEIVRRPTGGQALFHDPDDFTYCVILNPEDKFRNLMDSYNEICSWIVNAFSLLGINAEFDSKNSIIAENKKLCGNAQTRVLGPILQHGSIFYSLDSNKLKNIFNIHEKIIKEKAACIRDFENIPQKEAYNKFKESFLKNKGFFADDLNEEEWDRVNGLLKTKYKTDKWNFNFKKPNKGSCHVQ